MRRTAFVLIILVTGAALFVGFVALQGGLSFGSVRVSGLSIGYTTSPTISFLMTNDYSADLHEIYVNIDGNSFGPTAYLLHPSQSGTFTQNFLGLDFFLLTSGNRSQSILSTRSVTKMPAPMPPAPHHVPLWSQGRCLKPNPGEERREMATTTSLT